MKQAKARQTILREAYKPPEFLLDEVSLNFDIGFDETEVTSLLKLRRNPEAGLGDPLTLHGRDLALRSIAINGEALGSEAYTLDDEALCIPGLPDHCELKVVVAIKPSANTALEGLYASGKFLLTQCEAEGFRKITFFPDRPDVMTTYDVTLKADKRRFPVLLSNGNLIEEGDLPQGRHFVRWHDPHPKPAYLFALVAGDLAHVEDRFVTRSGREVALRIYVERENLNRCQHAMDSLKRSMSWDEERFGLEYDLDIFNIVATNDFNMGAMENKSLNIFNSKYVLAQPETATDADYQAIEGVIGHEYFHNWTGNRVTCRDWFQLTLKEGLTVFRDQEFSADMQSRAVKRIQDVRDLRRLQFAEDVGPMAHPIRPDQYIEINNFYTVTVYEKGAEVIRMIHTLLGPDGFRRGMDLYFQRHDGQAVTCDDFVAAMADANDFNLSQFSRWYSQKGTPVVDIKSEHDINTGTFRLVCRQSNPMEPGLTDQPLQIPLAVGLISESGKSLSLSGSQASPSADTAVLVLDQTEQVFEFDGVAEPAIPSLLRGFSAPVRVNYAYSQGELATLMAKDTDSFVRWESSQRLTLNEIQDLIERDSSQKQLSISPTLIEAFSDTLKDREADPGLLALMLTLPGDTYIADQMNTIDVNGIHRVKSFLQEQLGQQLRDTWLGLYEQLTATSGYQNKPEEIARRALRNCCLGYLCAAGSHGQSLALSQFSESDNMTDSLAALSSLVRSRSPDAARALAQFENRWRHDALVIDKWFSIQAGVADSATLSRVMELEAHDAFQLKNPNKVRALMGSFALQNLVGFHRRDGEAYRWLADRIIKLDQLNPQIAARLASAFNRWPKFDSPRQQKMLEELNRIATTPDLSPDVFEIVSNALKAE